jgi:hypothetical protein
MSDGVTPGTENRQHTDSSSAKKPTAHLEAHPWCKFERTTTVTGRRLDSVIPTVPIDLIWCDVQGAQLEVIAGAPLTLSRTRLLYIEVHPFPMYEGEPTDEELLAALPGWKVVERYEADVLLMRVEP